MARVMCYQFSDLVFFSSVCALCKRSKALNGLTECDRSRREGSDRPSRGGGGKEAPLSPVDCVGWQEIRLGLQPAPNLTWRDFN